MAEGHPGRGRLLAHVDGELAKDERRALRRHLEDCGRCRRRLEELESHGAVFANAAARLDRPVPEIANPAPGGGTGGGAATAGFPPLRAAAAVLLLLVGGALLTPAGRALAGLADLFSREPATAPATTTASDTTALRGGTAVSASVHGGRLEVAIESPDGGGGVIRVTVGAPGRAVVEGRVRDVERSPGRLRVRVDAEDGLRIRLPDSVGSAEVRVDGRSVLTQRGRQVVPSVPADTVDGELLIRAGP